MTYGEPAPASHGARPQPSTSTAALPRLLAFYRDEWDGDGVATGWRTVAWGLALADGTTISVPATGPAAVTMWASLADALAGLDAYVDDVAPRRRVADPGNSGVGQ